MPSTHSFVHTGVADDFVCNTLHGSDPEIAAAIDRELERQQFQIELIASENIVSRAVLEAQGSVLTNKYAEGYPGRRYYGGCEFVDVAETLAIERAKRLFGCGFANVQPHSGAQANQAVLVALLQPGDTILGMALAAGGHLTHGARPNLSGKWFNAIAYGVRAEDGRIDFAEVESLARQHRPKLIIAGGSAYSRIIDFDRFRAISDDVGAHLMVDMAHFAGLVAGGVYPSPLPHAHVVTTTTHKTLRGPRGGLILTDDAEIGKRINSAVFPALQGGPLMHVIAAKAVALHEALQPGFKGYAKSVVENAKVLAATLVEAGLEIVSGGTDSHLMLVDLRPLGLTGRDAETQPRARRHHLQQERHPIRPAKADGDVRDSPRLAGGDDPRLRPGGVPHGRELHRRGAACARSTASRQWRDRSARARECPQSLRPLSDLRRATRAAEPGRIEREREMRCPFCGADDTQVKDSRPTDDRGAIRRRRFCPNCAARFTTFERVQLRELTVLKKHGQREPFDRDKLARSIYIALRKRPVEPDRVERIINSLVRQLESSGETDIPSDMIGGLVMEALASLDQVAYIRFASVYRNFREAKDFGDFVGRIAADGN